MGYLMLAATLSCGRPSALAGDDDARPAPRCSVTGSIPYWAQPEAIASYVAHHQVVDQLSLFWYYLDPAGRVRAYRRARVRPELVDVARTHGTRVLGLVANLPDDEREGRATTWDARRVRRVLRTRATRARHVADLVALARRMRFDGLLVDYEALPRTLRAPFTAFIEELAAGLHADGRLLAVALHAKTSEDDPAEANGSEAQDWGALARVADQLHLMTYNQHTGATPGPVASRVWFERVLRYAVEQRALPADKLVVGIPLYAEQWTETGPGRYASVDQDLTYRDVEVRRARFAGAVTWSSDAQSPYMSYRDAAGLAHVVWFENARSTRAKLAAAATLGLCNVALWRLGDEAPGVWRALRAHVAHARRVAAADEGDAGDAADDADAGDDADDADDADDGDTDDADSPAGAADRDSVDDDTGAHRGAVARALHRHWPWLSLQGELAGEAEYVGRIAVDNPQDTRDNVISNVLFQQTTGLGSHVQIEQDVRVVLDSDGEDPRYYSEFPYRGVYLRTLLVRTTHGPVSAFAGRYEPAAGLVSQKAIFFGNYSTNLDLYGQLGGGVALTHDSETIGRHTLTAHAFRRDTSRLRGELFSNRGRDDAIYGQVGEYGPPDSVLVTLDGERAWGPTTIGYAAGGGRQGRGTLDAQEIALANSFVERDLGNDRRLKLSADALFLQDAAGLAEDRTIVGAGIDYEHPRFNLGAGYSARFVHPTDMTAVGADRVDHIVELVARAPLTHHVVAEAAYQWSDEWHATEHAVGMNLKYVLDWNVE